MPARSFRVTGRIVDIEHRCIRGAEVEVAGGRIRRIRPCDAAAGPYLMPGFVDAHVHIESSMLTPPEFARAAVRLVLAARGVDPDCLSIPESGMLARGRPAYVAALRGYASGSPAGMAEWLTWNATAIGYGAVLARGDG